MARSTAAAATKAPAPDGRAERSRRTRDALAEAMLALIEEGHVRPTAPQVAERAGVALRTVFHHFQDMERLLDAVAERQLRRVDAGRCDIPSGGPLAPRIAAFVAERARLHEEITPVRRAGLLHEPFSPAIAARLQGVREMQRGEVARVFAPELAARTQAERREIVEALAVASSWSAWEALRAHQAQSPAQTRRVVARIIESLLAERA
jgi:AcrR family transcriptional regulator